MSPNSKHDLGQVLGLILGRLKCLLNCIPELRDPVERLHEGGQRDEAGHQGEPPEVALAVVLQGEG